MQALLSGDTAQPIEAAIEPPTLNATTAFPEPVADTEAEAVDDAGAAEADAAIQRTAAKLQLRRQRQGRQSRRAVLTTQLQAGIPAREADTPWGPIAKSWGYDLGPGLKQNSKALS